MNTIIVNDTEGHVTVLPLSPFECVVGFGTIEEAKKSYPNAQFVSWIVFDWDKYLSSESHQSFCLKR